jgi:hypothetical protein
VEENANYNLLFFCFFFIINNILRIKMNNNGVLQMICVVAIAFVGIYLLQNISNGKKEHFAQSSNDDISSSLHMPQQCGSSCAYQPTTDYEPSQEYDSPESPSCPNPVISQCDQDMLYQDPSYQQLRQASCFPRSQLSPEELLPQDNCSLWAKVNPQGSGSLKDRNFLQAGWATGISTVGSTLRNANRQLRSEPPNPQVKVSPWLQTTVEPDISRKPLEIGGCA